ncbi:MAG: ribonuclease III family protein [Candidatus Hodarchaeales archaeon]
MIDEQIKKVLEKHYLFEFPINIEDQNQNFKLKEFLIDKRNSSLGDSLVNFIYSCAKTLNNNLLSSNKVPDTVLVNSYRESKIYRNFTLSGEKKKLGNYIESLILLVWSYGLLNMEEMIDRLKEEMTPDMFTSPMEEKRAATKAFTRLFNIIDNVIFD